MKGKLGGVAAAAACAIGLIGPATASAACDTAVNCAVERATTTVDDTKALAQQKVAETKALVDQTVANTVDLANRTLANTVALANKTVSDTVFRVGAGEHACVLQGRYYAASLTFAGVSDCVHRSRDTNPTTAHGTFIASNVTVQHSQNAAWLQFNDPRPITITDASGDTFPDRLDMKATELGAAAYTGKYTSAGPADNVAGAFALMSTAGLDPVGNPNDLFVEGALVFEALA
jgi:hypothetical protein